MSLSGEERKRVAEAFVEAANGRVPVIVQVGHNSLCEAAALAAHAEKIGADIISATCPSYFKVATVPALVDSMATIAGAAPNLPFYYYHIPMLTDSALDMVEFMSMGSKQIKNLVGLKYTSAKLHEFMEVVALQDNRFDVVWGFDEMLVGALASGTKAAIGSTYNVAAPLYRRIVAAFDSGDIAKARSLQLLSISMIRILNKFPFHSAMKAVLAMKGFELGGCRLPQGSLTQTDCETLRKQLDAIGFFDWSTNK